MIAIKNQGAKNHDCPLSSSAILDRFEAMTSENMVCTANIGAKGRRKRARIALSMMVLGLGLLYAFQDPAQWTLRLLAIPCIAGAFSVYAEVRTKTCYILAATGAEEKADDDDRPKKVREAQLLAARRMNALGIFITSAVVGQLVALVLFLVPFSQLVRHDDVHSVALDIDGPFLNFDLLGAVSRLLTARDVVT